VRLSPPQITMRAPIKTVIGAASAVAFVCVLILCTNYEDATSAIVHEESATVTSESIIVDSTEASLTLEQGVDGLDDEIPFLKKAMEHTHKTKKAVKKRHAKKAAKTVKKKKTVKHSVDDKPSLVSLHRTPSMEFEEELLEAEERAGTEAHKIYSSKLANNANTQYYGEIMVGPNKKAFKVVFDTGSSVLWIPSKQCHSAACKSHHQYDIKKSKTGHIIKAPHGKVRVAHIQYGTGSMTGVEASDKVQIGSMTIPHAGLLLATHEKSAVFSFFPFDGVLGLNRRHVAAEGTNFNVLQNAMGSGAMKKNIAAFWLGGKPGKTGGVMALGGADKRLYTGDMSWHPVVENPFGNWMIQLDSLEVGGVNVCKGGCTTIIDTGTSLMVASHPINDAMKKLIKVSPDCSGFAKNPAMKFTFGKNKGKSVELRPADYTVEMVSSGSGTKRCSSSFVPMQGTLLNKISKIVPQNSDRVIIMGDAFLRSVYTAFDNSDPKKPLVGFAQAKRVLPAGVADDLLA